MRKSKKNKTIMMLVFAALAAGIGYFFYKKWKKRQEMEQTVATVKAQKTSQPLTKPAKALKRPDKSSAFRSNSGQRTSSRKVVSDKQAAFNSFAPADVVKTALMGVNHKGNYVDGLAVTPLNNNVMDITQNLA